MTTESNGTSREALANLAKLVASSLSMERYFASLIGKIPPDEWDATFKRNPTWFGYYFMPPQALLQKAIQIPGVVDSFDSDHDASSEQQWSEVLSHADRVAREAVGLSQDLSSHDGVIEFDLDGTSPEDALEMLAIFKALMADLRARCFYGQGIATLIAAGQRGNDDGYYRAASIDPTVQWHSSIAERVSRETLAGETGFAEALARAAKTGPSKHIDPGLHQLRSLLCVLHESGDLARLSEEDRYELFCRQLNLYPDTGKDPKAALCIFINRWKSSLLTTT